MPKKGIDVTMFNSTRVLIQPQGAGTVVYAGGKEVPHFQVTGATNPRKSNPAPVYRPDPEQQSEYVKVGSVKAAPELAGVSFAWDERYGGIPYYMSLVDGATAYRVSGRSGVLTSTLTGWENMRVFPNCEFISDALGNQNGLADDAAHQATQTVVSDNPFDLAPINFSTDATVTTEVAGVCFGKLIRTSLFGKPLTAVSTAYRLEKPASGNKPKVAYYVNGAWSAGATIAAAANDEAPVAIGVVGTRLIVASPTAGSSSLSGFYIADIDQTTGVPGTFTKITTGAVSNKLFADMYIDGNTVYFAATGGYVYKSTDVTAGFSAVHLASATTENLNRIHGKDGVIVAVGANNAVIRSVDNGANWTSIVGPAVSTALTAVDVRSKNVFRVGGGNLYQTFDGGANWTSSVAATTLSDVRFANDYVGYAVSTSGTPTSTIYVTVDGGANWTASGARIGTAHGSIVTANRIAVPELGSETLKANNILVACLGATASGIVYRAVAPTV